VQDLERGPGDVALRRRGAEVRVRAGGREARDGRRLRQQTPAVRVVGVHDGGRARFAQVEQAPLRGEVTLHVAVKIEVIARQVREDRDVEPAALRAVERERVRGDLHRGGGHPLGDQLGEDLLDHGRLGSGAVRLDRAAAGPIAGRPDEPGRPPPRLEDRGEQSRR
jgi:hypothetical protein